MTRSNLDDEIAGEIVFLNDESTLDVSGVGW
jgi:hypothetical protein